jgi:hypothetical protein
MIFGPRVKWFGRGSLRPFPEPLDNLRDESKIMQTNNNKNSSFAGWMNIKPNGKSRLIEQGD